jgi:HEAT repeat protein
MEGARMRSLQFLLVGCTVYILAAYVSANSVHAAEGATDPDEKILRDAKIESDNAGLLAFLRKKCGDEGDLLGMSGLVRQLGSEKFDERKTAHRKIAALGFVTVPLLQRAARTGDAETSRQAKSCLAEIAKETTWWVPPAVIRLLVRRNPEGTTEALMQYLPFAPEGDAEEEIWFGLSAMASSGKVSLPVLRKALNDPLVARRSLAACLLGRIGSERDRQAVRVLLKDDDPTVRLCAAQGLLAAKDKSGISVLISLLDEPSGGIAWQAEELLRWIAGENSPKELLGSGKPGEIKKCKDAWDRIWQARLEQKDLFKVGEDSRRPGLILVSGWDNENPGQNLRRVWLCGSDGTVRWQKGKISDLSCTGKTGQGRVMIVQGLESLRFTEEASKGILFGITLTTNGVSRFSVAVYPTARQSSAVYRLFTDSKSLIKLSPIGTVNDLKVVNACCLTVACFAKAATKSLFFLKLILSRNKSADPSRFRQNEPGDGTILIFKHSGTVITFWSCPMKEKSWS